MSCTGNPLGRFYTTGISTEEEYIRRIIMLIFKEKGCF